MNIESCQTCKYWRKILHFKLGHCIKNAPVGINTVNQNGIPFKYNESNAAWPQTLGTDWCGNYFIERID